VFRSDNTNVLCLTGNIFVAQTIVVILFSHIFYCFLGSIYIIKLLPYYSAPLHQPSTQMENIECVQPLPRKITSTHTLCAEKSSSLNLNLQDDGDSPDSDIPEQFTTGLKHFQEKEYSVALECLQLCNEVYPPAKYQTACMHYDGLGCKANRVSVNLCTLTSRLSFWLLTL